MIWIELAILLACIVVGARLGGIALGTVAGIGLLVFVFGFGLHPGGPPGVVVGMIIAVITALATMQAAGGLDWLVSVAERVLRSKPQYITFVAPVVTYVLIFASGTTHVIYALLPVIAAVSRKAGIRPERPLSISVIAGFLGVVASPISAATVALVGVLGAQNVTLANVLAVTVPSTFLGVLAGALSVAKRGKPLAEDPEAQARLAVAETAAPGPREGAKAGAAAPAAELTGAALFNARGSTLLFLAGIVLVVLIGIFPSLRPVYEVTGPEGMMTEQVSMAAAIMIVMIATAGLTMLLFKASPAKALSGNMMSSGISAVICIVGVAWLGSSFFEGNRAFIVGGISGLIESHPWTFAIGLFALSSMLFSAAATVSILMPVGVALGLPASSLIAFYPAANGVFFLPTYGTLLAAVSFDQTGTTKIGKYLLNHSFMLPGLVAVATSIGVGVLIQMVLAP
ncbi:MAG TPA: anaerobic C4-dicarboxylate transporter family protein [Candidatus Polarisedimenticolia bacterium]|nr:anaerobic C4-dicarboxylate transporter family protein [Candidatus Polarisedimenticolia bacterium]